MAIRRRRRALFAVAYLVLLGASHLVRLARRPGPPPAEAIAVREIAHDRAGERRVTLAYRDRGPGAADRAPVLLLHGSPGSGRDFTGLMASLPPHRRAIAPDLPGFGASERRLADYSIRAHARYALELLDALHLARVHVVGFSMGGGVGLELYDRAPDRVASLTLLSAIGVQELELFGDRRTNRLAHGVQLAGLVAIHEGLPHFGWLDDSMLGVPYARNFYDTDQRPLRGILQRVAVPTLILHGREDPLVPLAAAEEHHRLVPQSELLVLPASHFMVFRDAAATALRIEGFLERVDRGRAPDRAAASAERVRAAAAPFDFRHAPPLGGFALALTAALLTLSTFVSEDLACIAAGLMIARERIDWLPAIVACLVGILAGDLLLFLAGRVLGRPALRHAPLRWLVRPDHIAISTQWFERRGPVAILLSRFVPGTRLPTYLAAGLLHTGFWRFLGWFLLAVAIWTPLVVGLAALVGERAFGWLEAWRMHALVGLAVLVLVVFAVVKGGLALVSFQGRRRAWGRLRRVWNWEFWPPWLFYSPVVAWIAWLGVRHRGPLLFTAANPAMPAGGFVAESKWDILCGLGGAEGHVARTGLVRFDDRLERRLAEVARFREQHGLDLPLVLKPDAGQRGSGVAVIREEAAIRSYFERARYDVLVQEYVAGSEFGVFYQRRPDSEHGTIVSITEKRLPMVVGDGRRTIEQLVLSDRRAVTLADRYLGRRAHESSRVPEPGEQVPLVELGTHCRGAIFLDGGWLRTAALEQAIDRISRGYRGFYFGRYDLRTPDVEALRRGQDFKIIELNGVTSEVTHIYDPRIGLLGAWRALCEQWSAAFDIGGQNRRRGVATARWGELLGLWRQYRRLARYHPP